MVPYVGLRSVIVVFPSYTHFLRWAQEIQILSLYFVQDHIYYARWLPVNLFNKLALKQLHSDKYTEIILTFVKFKKYSL